MSRHPRFQEERERLLLRLEEQKRLIQRDIEALKQAAKPLEVAKEVVTQAADSFHDNTLATQSVRLAITAVTRSVPHPVVGIAAQIAVPLVLRNFPQVVGWVQQGVVKISKVDVVDAIRRAVRQAKEKWRRGTNA
jgi:hypothetical protein